MGSRAGLGVLSPDDADPLGVRHHTGCPEYLSRWLVKKRGRLHSADPADGGILGSAAVVAQTRGAIPVLSTYANAVGAFGPESTVIIRLFGAPRRTIGD
jgi:hypothetical protein